MNERSDVPAVEKQNEALKVMPVLFEEAGYDVTVCDPPLAGYKEVSDLSIYDAYPDIDTHITMGAYLDDSEKFVQTSRQGGQSSCSAAKKRHADRKDLCL